MIARRERRRRSGGGRGTGIILLDVALAIAILVIAGLVILNALGQALHTQRVARERERLVDLARSAMALIESGAASAESLSGPVAAWPASLAGPGRDEASRGGAGERAAGSAAWSLRVETRPWGAGGGLAAVTVEARREGAGLDLSYRLVQVVRVARPVSAARAAWAEGAAVEAEP